jgi:hypothetical protein
MTHPMTATTPGHDALIDEARDEIPQLTEVGYEVIELDPDLLAFLDARLQATWFAPNHLHFRLEHASPREALSHGLADARWDLASPPETGECPSWVNRGDPTYQALLIALQPLHEHWAGTRLEPIQFYGPRVYRRHATLLRHVDTPETHIVSSSVTLASSLEAPWPLVLEPAGRAPVELELAPGQMLLYEGARIPHHRPRALVGEHYINLFLHYRPVGWRSRRATRPDNP